MNKTVLRAAIASALLCPPAHAVTLTAEGIFDTTYSGHSGEVDPRIEGSGFFTITESRIADFEFSMFGFTWDVDDVLAVCRPDDGCIDEGIHTLHKIIIDFADEQGSGRLLWDFVSSNFSLTIEAGEWDFIGTAENGQASGAFSAFSHRINLPEPGTVSIFALGLLGLAYSRQSLWRVLMTPDRVF